MTGSRYILPAAALAFLVAGFSRPGWTGGEENGCITHEKGRVRAGLRLNGNLGPCGGTGLRWPGDRGDEFLSGGGLLVRYTNAAGERVVSGTFETVTFWTEGLFDGCERGKRYPHPSRDDDGDGVADEDPPDGRDNDGDGSTDEDFAAAGDEMLVTVSADGETGLVRKQSSYTWTSGHVRDFIGFTTSIVYPREAEDALRELEAVLYVDFGIGGAGDPSRGRDDHLFVIEREWEGGQLRLPAVRDGNRFAALLLLDAVGPRGEALEARALLVPAGEPPWGTLEKIERDGGDREAGLPKPVRVLPRDEGERATDVYGEIDGDGAVVCCLEPLPEFWPGERLTVQWAVVFGNTESRLVRNALRAMETYDGLPDGEGSVHRWIVPARRAARVSLEASSAFVWSQGIRQPAATIVLPSSLEGEEVEWLRGLNAAELQYQQVGEKILVTVEGQVDAGATVLVEGQLTNGTIFTASLSGELLLGTDESGSPDSLPDESVQLYPNPFLTSLNINLRIFDSTLTEEAAGSSSVRIYDVRGRLVRTVLEQGPLHPGEYLYTWDGLDEYGKEASPGVYYVKLQIGERSVTKRVILLR